MGTITHQFVSAIPDDPASVTAGEVVPSNWNEEHVFNLTTADVPDSANKRYVTDAKLAVLNNTSGTNTGDQTITLSGDVTGSGTAGITATLANTAVSAGSYTLSSFTVDAKGRITAASSGTSYFRLVGTAYVGGDQTGNTRGVNSIDVQGARGAVTQVASGQNAVAMGRQCTASATAAISMGSNNSASGQNSGAIGTFNNVTGTVSCAVGLSNQALANSCAAVGYGNSVKNSGDVAVGYNQEIEITIGGNTLLIGQSQQDYSGQGANVAIGAINQFTDTDILTGLPATAAPSTSFIIGKDSYVWAPLAGCVGSANFNGNAGTLYIGTCLDLAADSVPDKTIIGTGPTATYAGGAGTLYAYFIMDSVTGKTQIVGGALSPNAAETTTLGETGKGYKDLYLSRGANTTAGASATINKASGRFRVSAGTTAFTLTNSHISAGDVVICQPCQSDATGLVKSTVPAAGNAVINLVAPTASMDVMFFVIKSE